MIISKITTRNIGFSRSPVTLKRNLVTNTSIFDDFNTRERGGLALSHARWLKSRMRTA